MVASIDSLEAQWEVPGGSGAVLDAPRLPEGWLSVYHCEKSEKMSEMRGTITRYSTRKHSRGAR